MISTLKSFLNAHPKLKASIVGSIAASKKVLWGIEFRLFILILVLLSPFANFRFARFRTEKIGHFISEGDLALTGVLDNWNTPEKTKHNLVFFIMADSACNDFLRTLYLRSSQKARAITLLDCRRSWWARRLRRATERLTVEAQRSQKHTRFFAGAAHSGGISHTGLITDHVPHLELTENETEDGWSALSAWGLTPSSKFVCVHIRDDAFLNHVSPERDWTYHDYRNPDIANYIPGIQQLLDEGLTVFRMGRVASHPLPIKHPLLIDYAFHKERSDFLDVFLYKHADLVVAGSASGIDNLGYAFHRSTVLLDLIPFEPHQSAPDVLITPCLLKDRVTGNVLALSEMGRHRYARTIDYERAGLQIQRATREEVTAAIMEGLRRRRGLWQDSTKDSELQDRFWRWAEDCGVNDGIRLGPPGSRYYQHRIATSFLRNHAAALLA